MGMKAKDKQPAEGGASVGTRGENGRPTLLTPAVQKKIVNCILAGNYQEVAARAAGIKPRTMKLWMAEGRKRPDSNFAKFMNAVLEAEADAESGVVEKALKAGSDDPANYWKWLERKHGIRWGKIKDELYEMRRELKQIKDRLGTDN